MRMFRAKDGSNRFGYEHAGLFSRITYSFVDPLVRLGVRQEIEENTSEGYLPSADRAEKLSKEFNEAYVLTQTLYPSSRPASLLWRTYWRMYKWRLMLHLLWTVCEVAVRVASPVIARQLIAWFVGNEAFGSSQYPAGEGWLWAGLLGLMGYLYTLVHHQLFWVGMRSGFRMRIQAMAAVQAKVLRLNSVAVADVSPGKIINLVSNDVRRLDDAATFWNFLLCGPLELMVVLVLVGLRLGFPAAVAGVAALLALIPVQGTLARYIGQLRSNTATQTDERVRLTSEAIDGVLAAKMMSWEIPLMDQILGIRAREATYIRRMSRIRAMNMALSFAMAPLVSLITFAVARATSQQLTVADVFYALALLSLPRVYMAEFFVRGTEFVSEARISMQRLGEFLQLPEPPAPVHHHCHPPQQQQQAVHGGSDKPFAPGPPSTFCTGSGGVTGEPGAEVVLSVMGADFDWEDRSWAKGGRGGLASPTGINANGNRRTGSSVGEGGVVGAPAVVRAPTLQDINFSVRRGQLVGIVGEVGGGKSSLLAALLGELQPIQAPAAVEKGEVMEGQVDCSSAGRVYVGGDVAYCSQVPWVISDTLKENILFGSVYNKERYEAVLSACALVDDIAGLPAGDETQLGERGVNLSGGQKARLALARAAYSAASILLLDDPLSAVDPRVGRALFKNCIGPGGIMEGCTRFLVTHQRQYLPSCDTLLVMAGGCIVDRGTYQELKERGVTAVVASHEAELDDAAFDQQCGEQSVEDTPSKWQAGEDSDESESEPEADKESESGTAEAAEEPSCNQADASTDVQAGNGRSKNQKGAVATLSRKLSSFFGVSGKREAKGQLAPGSTTLRRFLSSKLAAGANKKITGQVAEAVKSGQLIVGEERASGGVSWQVYGQYFKYMGIPTVVFIAVCLLAGQAAYLIGDYWLARWASASPQQQQRAYWVWGFSIFAGCVTVVAVVRALLFFSTALQASTTIHNSMVERVLRAPLSFFHTNPTGRVLNRFSRDQGAVDEQLPQCMFDALQALMMAMGAFVLLMVVVPFIIPVFLPLGFGFFWVRRRYLATSREVKRFEAISRSPVYASFSAVIKGLPTIRAYDAGDRFRATFLSDLSRNGSWWFCFLTTSRWVGFRLDMLVALLMTVASLLMMAVHSRLEARLVGLALTQSLQLSGLLQWMARQSAEVENHMTSVERMLHYTQLSQEPPTVAQGGGSPPTGWPALGRLEYDKVTAIYRPGLPPVLKGLDFVVQGGVSCGVVGRTGSGKSSLMLTLFRLIPITRGNIRIDGVDTSTLGLDALRRQIAIIPQDPVLFSGTLRSNLDPWSDFEDHCLWEALKKAQLGDVVSSLGGLDSRMSEAGDNLSVGQRQLFCLARALLQESAILALDEATANVDRATDALIQQAVRDCSVQGVGGHARTLLVIAHRMDTIMDCDQLLVLQKGRLVESGAPLELAKQPGGTFARLMAAARAAGSNGNDRC